MKNFTLPSHINPSEALGLHFTFQEIRTRGSKNYTCQLLVTSDSNDFNEVFSFPSWDSMMKKFPTPLDFLKMFSNYTKWMSDHMLTNKVFFISKLDGNEGIYDIEHTIWIDKRDFNKNSFSSLKIK